LLEPPYGLASVRWFAHVATCSVVVSILIGRFVCNWVFYQSLRQSSSLGTHSLFVHVPSHQVYDLAAQQQFATEVIRAVVDELDRQEAGGEKTSKVASSTTTSDSAHSNPDEQLRR
jgi:hypothetical protein